MQDKTQEQQNGSKKFLLRKMRHTDPLLIQPAQRVSYLGKDSGVLYYNDALYFYDARLNRIKKLEKMNKEEETEAQKKVAMEYNQNYEALLEEMRDNDTYQRTIGFGLFKMSQLPEDKNCFEQDALILTDQGIIFFDFKNKKEQLIKNTASNYSSTHELLNKCNENGRFANNEEINIITSLLGRTRTITESNTSHLYHLIRKVALPRITYFINMGDSLSDTGEMDHRMIWGFLPGAIVSGLDKDHSSMGRFTNGLVWVDDMGLNIEQKDKHKAIEARGIIACKWEKNFVLDEQGYPAKESIKALEKLTQDAFIQAPNGLFYYDKAHRFFQKVSDQNDIGIHFDNQKLTEKQLSDITTQTKFEIPMTRQDIEKLHGIYLEEDNQNAAYLINEQLLNNFHHIKFNNQLIIRKYAEGGLTAANYRNPHGEHAKQFVEGHILSNLDEQRTRLLEDDRCMGLSIQHKANTLFTQWCGANDLITINSIQTGFNSEAQNRKNADKAIAAIKKNLEIAAKNGYQHFAVFNLPNLALVPFFQQMDGQGGEDIRPAATEVTNYFNKKLQEVMQELNQNHPDADFEIFDVSTIFTKAFDHPKNYGFNPDLKKRYLSEDFNNPQQMAGRDQYMFWNNVHPSAAMQRILYEKFHTWAKTKYHYDAPHETAADKFKHMYGAQLALDKRSRFGFFRHSRLENYLHRPDLLKEAFYHAIYDGGKRTKKILMDMGWLNKENVLVLSNEHTDYASVQKAYDDAKNDAKNRDSIVAKNMNKIF